MASALHLKYRPKTLDKVLGHDKVVASIRAVLKKGTSRAFILTGPSGTGKTTLARIIGRMAECDPANLTEIDAATHTGVDAMRSVTEGLQYAPLMGSNGNGSAARLTIIDEAHALSKPAWQSLLKIVEEPPPHTWWAFCTTEAEKIPATIRNRCTTYDLKPVPAKLVYQHLERVAKKEGMDLEEDILELISEKCGGSVRLALNVLAQCAGCKDRKEAAELLKAAAEEGEVIDLARALVKGVRWDRAAVLLKAVKDVNAESVRIQVCGYVSAILLNTSGDKQAAALLDILEAFADPYPPSSGIYPLVRSVGRVVVP